MLNPFPELLTYTFFAPLVLRLSVGFLLFFAGWHHLVAQRTSIVSAVVSRVGSKGAGLVWYIGTLEFIVAIGLVAGYLTQIAALIGIGLCLHLFWLARNESPAALFSAGTYFLMVVILATLMVTGAGAMAVDMPL